MEICRRSSWLLPLLGVILLAVALQGVQGEVETEGPSESECRPYIEKALRNLEHGAGDADVGQSNEEASSVENKSKDENQSSEQRSSEDSANNTETEQESQEKEPEADSQGEKPEETDSKTDDSNESDKNEDQQNVDNENKESSETESGESTQAAKSSEDETDQTDKDHQSDEQEQANASGEAPKDENDSIETVEVTGEEPPAETQASSETEEQVQLSSSETLDAAPETSSETAESVQDKSGEDSKEDQSSEKAPTQEEADDSTSRQEGANEDKEAEVDQSDENQSTPEKESPDSKVESGETNTSAESIQENDSQKTASDESDKAEEDKQKSDESAEEQGKEQPGEEEVVDDNGRNKRSAEESSETTDKDSEKESDDSIESVETTEKKSVEESTEVDREPDKSIESAEKKEGEADSEKDEKEEDNEDEVNTETESKGDSKEGDSKEGVEGDVKETEETDTKEGEESKEGDSRGDSKEDNRESSKEDSKGDSNEYSKGDSKEENNAVNDDKDNSEQQDANNESKEDSKNKESTESDSLEEAPEEDLIIETDIPHNLRPRDHVEHLLKLDREATKTEEIIDRISEITLRELKRLYENAIKPLETLYKYRDLSNRHYGDAEIFSKPLILFMGPWSGGKSSIINYLLDVEYNDTALRTGAEPSPAYFNLLMYGEEEEVTDGTQIAADYTFSGLQKFGQGLEERLRGVKLKSKLLEKMNIVEIPGILEVRKQVSRVFPFNDACQWFIDRADIIFLVYDPSKLDVGPETEAILDQLKGREYQTRIILNKADQVKPEELMRVQGALIWNISPLMSSPQPPIMYTTSLWSRPYEHWAPVRLLQAQERAFLRDLRSAVDKRIENKIASARRFAVRVRNHAKMVDCYLTTYYNHKSIFGNRKLVSDAIIEHPQDYHIYEGLSTLTNISRYDLPDPDVYKDFFRLNPLYEFQQLSATCTYFRGCPINKLDVAIAYDLPELVGKHKRQVEAALAESNQDQTQGS